MSQSQTSLELRKNLVIYFVATTNVGANQGTRRSFLSEKQRLPCSQFFLKENQILETT